MKLTTAGGRLLTLASCFFSPAQSRNTPIFPAPANPPQFDNTTRTLKSNSDYSLDPNGLRVKFLKDDFFEIPDAPSGGAHLIRLLPRKEIHIQMVADTGSDQTETRDRVLSEMLADAINSPPHLRAILGDLVYEIGVDGPWDPKILERVYIFGLDTECMVTIGNHDIGKKRHRMPDSTAYLDSHRMDGKVTPEIADAGEHRGSCSMKQRYYSISYLTPESVEPFVQIFTLDTNIIHSDDEQQQWLEEGLANSRAEHKLIFGHHPIFSVGPDHPDSPPFGAWLWPLANKHDVTALFFGHEHNMQARQAPGKPIQIVAGSGSKISAPKGIHKKSHRLEKIHKSVNTTAIAGLGFASFQADSTSTRIDLHHILEEGGVNTLNVLNRERSISHQRAMSDSSDTLESESDSPSTQSGMMSSWIWAAAGALLSVATFMSIKALSSSPSTRHEEAQRLVDRHSGSDYQSVAIFPSRPSQIELVV